MRNITLPLTRLRTIVQFVFAMTSIFIGWRFVNYYLYIESSGLSGSPYRPPGVEAFLPLSALVGLRAWLGTGSFDYVHPAGVVVLLAALLISLLFRKAFCSWICPFGLLEDMLSRLGLKIRPSRLRMPRWLDLILRGLKYVLLAFFIGSVFYMMSGEAAMDFVNSPYNKVADLEMLDFFMNISLKGILIFGFLITMSLLFDHFWCRYLCPYGALTGLLGWFSPAVIARKEELCTNCKACDRVCSGHLKVSQAQKVISPECNSCLNCVDKCPVPGALEYRLSGIPQVRNVALPAAMLVLFAGLIIAAMAAGYWESSVPLEEVFEVYSYFRNI